MVEDGGVVSRNLRREWSSGSEGGEARPREEAEYCLCEEEFILDVRKWYRLIDMEEWVRSACS